MEGEINNLVMVCITVVASLCYCHTIGNIITPGTTRLIPILPVILVFLVLPLNLRTILLGGPISFFVAWLANFKLLLFAYGKGPLSSNNPLLPLPLSRFIALASFPIKIQDDPINKQKKSLTNYAIKALIFSTIIPVQKNKSYIIYPKVFLSLHFIYIYTFLEIMLATVAALVRATLGVELEPHFEEPYLSTSLQDFWGRRWNLMASDSLRSTVSDHHEPLDREEVGPSPRGDPDFYCVWDHTRVYFLQFGKIKAYVGSNVVFRCAWNLLLAAEIAVKKAINRKWRLPPLVTGSMALAFVMSTVLWLFMPDLMRLEIDIKAEVTREKILMEGEINNLVVVWITAVSSLCYCHTIGNIFTPGTTRLIAILPVILIFLVLPLNLRTISLRVPILFFVAWLANFKLLLFAYGKGPLSSNNPLLPLPLSRFIPLASFPIKIQDDPIINKQKKSLTNYAIKALILSTIIPIQQNKSSIHPNVFLFFYCIYNYIILEIIVATVAALVRAALGVELEPNFEEPYLSTSLQDFWGRRWNLIASDSLRSTVYIPVRTMMSRWIGRKWAPVPAVIPTFMVSGIIHEFIFYNMRRSKPPTWEVTLFFVVHGMCLAAEIAVKKAVNRKWRLPPVVSGSLAVAFVMTTKLWLFMPALMALEADVNAHREMIEFVKSIKSEINNLVMVWITVVASLYYCHTIGNIITPGTTRLIPILPVILVFLVLPLNLRTIFLGGPISFFVAWLANFKLLLFVYGKGPLSSNNPLLPLPLSHFITLASFPIKILNNPINKQKKSLTNYAIKALIFSTIIPVQQNKSYIIYPKVFLSIYFIYIYTFLEIMLATVAALVRAALGVELEPHFEEPYLSTSLQDFWGRRWNLMASDSLRSTVYIPVRTVMSRWIGRKWAPVPAVIPTFMVSGIIHEFIFYNLGRSKPRWEVTLFFVVHGICLAAEIAVKKAINRKWRLPPLVTGSMALAFVMSTVLWLFMPDLIRLEVDIKAEVTREKILMESELNNLVMVWITVVASLCYCHTIGKIITPGTARLIAILPVILIFLVLPLNLRTIILGGPISFFVAWLANFKLLLFAYGKGPLSSNPLPLPLSRFIPLASFPIKIQDDPLKKQKKSLTNYAIKALIFSTIIPVQQNKSYSIHPKVFMSLYFIYIYIFLEIIQAAVAALVRAALGAELEPHFDEPYLSTSLQDFWGRRWNLMASDSLRSTVYIPVRNIMSRWIGRKWAPVPAVIPTFMMSGIIHEFIFYSMRRSKPTWEVTLLFVVHGMCLAAEIAVKKAVNRKWRLPPLVSGSLAVAFLMTTALWLFMPALMRLEVDVKAYSEINNLVMVWITVVASLCYCHTIGKIITPGTTRLIPILPVILVFLVLPLNLRTIFLGGPISFFVAWLANFKLLLFAYGKGPLSSNNPLLPLPLSHFITLASFPIKILDNPINKQKKSLTNYAIKALILSTIIPIQQNKSSIHPNVFLFLYSIYMYIALEIILATVAASVRAALCVELEPQFEEPYLSTSLQDFWGRRWNLMASAILRATVYVPVRTVTSRWIGRKWAPVPAVIAAFLVSGIMHELIFYNIGRLKPTWEVTWFFALHGICLAAEVSVKKAVNEKWRLPPLVSGFLAVAFVMATGLWLFLPALMRLEADVMAYREMIAFIDFIKSVSNIKLRMDKAII
ncbi:hypothetical protein G4B88_022622, partial [Cannabis sativa]